MFEEDRRLRELLHRAAWIAVDAGGRRRLRPLVPPGDLVDGKVAHWNLVEPTGGFTSGPDALLTDGIRVFVLEAKRGDVDGPAAERHRAIYEAWGYAKQLAAALTNPDAALFVSGNRASGVSVREVLGVEDATRLAVVPTLVEVVEGAAPSRLRFEEAAGYLRRGELPVRGGPLNLAWQKRLSWDSSPSEFGWAAADAVDVSAAEVILQVAGSS